MRSLDNQLVNMCHNGKWIKVTRAERNAIRAEKQAQISAEIARIQTARQRATIEQEIHDVDFSE
jgi:hypothetical protein